MGEIAGTEGLISWPSPAMARVFVRDRMAGMLGLSAIHILIFAVVGLLLFGGRIGWLLKRWLK